MSLIKMIRQGIRMIARVVSRLFRFGLKASLVLLVVGLLTYGVLNIWYYSGEVQINRDFVAELTAKAREASPEDRAWPIYREAMLVLDPLSFTKIERVDPEHPDWESNRELIEQHQEQIDLIRIGASKGSFGFVPGTPFDGPGLRSEREGGWEERLVHDGVLDTSELIDATLNTIHVSRAMVTILLIDAAVAEAEGDSDRIIRDLVAVIRIADHTREIPFVLCDLTALANYNLARMHIDGLLHRAPGLISNDQLEALELALSSFMGGAIEGRLNPEREVINDIIQRSYTDNGKGNGHIVRPRATAESFFFTRAPAGRRFSLLGPIELLYMPSRKEAVDVIDRVYTVLNQSAGKPFHQQSNDELNAAFDDLLFGPRGSMYDRIPYLEYVRMLRWGDLNRILSTLPPSTYYAAHQMAAFLRDQTIAVIAMERYRRDQGGWPSALDELVPEYLERLPVDVFDAQPIRCRIDEELGPILYSIGSNLEDDGGVFAIDEDGAPTNEGSRRWIGDREEVQRMREVVRAGGRSSMLRVEADYVLWPPLTSMPRLDESEPDSP